jgi:hypothetical protein
MNVLKKTNPDKPKSIRNQASADLSAVVATEEEVET